MVNLAVIAPCLDEEPVLRIFHDRVCAAVASWEHDGEHAFASFVFVDDGSTDGTWDEIVSMCADHVDVCGVKLSRNFGQQPALVAGYNAALEIGADVVVAMDVDLQDDPEAIPQMLDEWARGADIVFGVRSDRSVDGPAKRFFANAFHSASSALGVPSTGNASEFSLMSRYAVEAMLRHGERDLYLRGVRASMGLKTSTVSYRRGERAAGETAYTFRKSLALGMQAVFSFSTKPLRLISLMAGLSAVIAVAMAVWALVQHATGHVVDGWSSLMVSLWFAAAMLLASSAIIGRYLAGVLVEVKGRPLYIVDEDAGFDRVTWRGEGDGV